MSVVYGLFKQAVDVRKDDRGAQLTVKLSLSRYPRLLV